MSNLELISAPAPASSATQSVRAFFAQPAIQKSLPTLGGVSALALAGLAWWAFQTPAQRPVFEGLADADKGAVIDALRTAGIATQVNSASGAVEVAESEVHSARITLASLGLPKAAPAGDALISTIPMGSSRAVEGETLRGAREADLARTIEAIDAVKVARIHLASAEASPFVRDTVPPAASVMLTLEGGRSLSEAQVRAIRHLVASSVTGLAPTQVSIVDQSGQLLSQEEGNGAGANFQLQVATEERYRQALATLLSPVVGVGNYTAEVSALMSASESQSTRETFPKDDRALIAEQGNKSSTSSEAPVAMGIPGALSNQPPPPSQLTQQPPAAPAPASAQAEGNSNETFSRSFTVGREVSVTHQPQGQLKRLSIAVAVRDLSPKKPRTKAELASIEALVKGAVGFDAARGDVVIVNFRPFATVEDVPVAWWDNPLALPLLRQVGGLIAALLVLFFIGHPLLRALKDRANRPAPEGNVMAIAGPELTLDRDQVTLDMIEKAPSYEVRAQLVRSYVQQDRQKAGLVVQQLMGANRGR